MRIEHVAIKGWRRSEPLNRRYVVMGTVAGVAANALALMPPIIPENQIKETARRRPNVVNECFISIHLLNCQPETSPLMQSLISF